MTFTERAVETVYTGVRWTSVQAADTENNTISVTRHLLMQFLNYGKISQDKLLLADIVRPPSRDVQPDDERVNDLGVESAAAQWLWLGPRHNCLGVMLAVSRRCSQPSMDVLHFPPAHPRDLYPLLHLIVFVGKGQRTTLPTSHL